MTSKSRYGMVTTLHVRVLDQGVEEVCGLDERESSVPKRGDGGVHADPDARDGHVHEVGVLIFLTGIVLQSLQEFQKNLLGDFTPSSL